MTDDDQRRIESVRRKLVQAQRDRARLSDSERQGFMRAFWLVTLSPEEAETWLRCKLRPGYWRWEAGMTPAERLEQRLKISEAALAEDRSARNRKMWAKRSKTKRRAVGAAITAGQKRYWATATLEWRQRRSLALRAAWARRRGRQSETRPAAAE
jgi:hypothetical protein